MADYWSVLFNSWCRVMSTGSAFTEKRNASKVVGNLLHASWWDLFNSQGGEYWLALQDNTLYLIAFNIFYLNIRWCDRKWIIWMMPLDNKKTKPFASHEFFTAQLVTWKVQLSLLSLFCIIPFLQLYIKMGQFKTLVTKVLNWPIFKDGLDLLCLLCGTLSKFAVRKKGPVTLIPLR